MSDILVKEAYQAQSFEHLLGIPGFSDKMLKDHFKLYEGYVKNTNELLNRLALAGKSEEPKSPQNAEMRRRFGWEFDGMRLHELYFGNLGPKASPPAPQGALARKLGQTFASFEHWKKEFTGIGMMRGIGWVLLVYDRVGDRLLNIWVNEHDTGHLAGTEPLLVMDVFEHAFMTDYGLDKEKYITSFWNAVLWSEVERRFDLRQIG